MMAPRGVRGWRIGRGFGVLVLVMSLALTPGEALGQSYPNREKLGMNMPFDGPLSRQWDFTNLMKNAGQWSIRPDGATFGPDGWPTFIPEGERVGTNLRLELANPDPLADRTPDLPAGEYTVQWQGAGTVQITGGFGVQELDGPGGTATFEMPADQTQDQIFLGIRETDPAQPLRLQIHMPSYGPGQANAGQTFHQTFKQRMQPFKRLRFMDWMKANDNDVVNWSDRNEPGRYTYVNDRSVPVENMVELANELDADPWFTMPVKADDQYVENFATYVKQNLDSDQKIYVEYGNEVWNPTFIGRDHVEDLAEDRYNDRSMWYKTWAEEAKADFNVWHNVFAGEEDRIVRVAASQEGNRFHSPRFYDELDGQFDAIAMANYISPNPSSLDENTSAADILQAMRDAIERESDTTIIDPDEPAFLLGDTEPKGDWAYQQALAEYFTQELGREIDLINYEGGQGLSPGGDTSAPWLDAYIAAQRDDEMADVYQQLFDAWLDKLGAEQFNHFSSISQINQFGAWGALERTDQPLEMAPKYRALFNFAMLPEPGSALLLGVGLGGLALGRRRSVTRRAH
jgi:hypothetical protein